MSLELIFIGNRFYDQSRTMMSCIYTIDGQRSDWGQVQIALTAGETVNIRPANRVELQHYQEKLDKLNKSNEPHRHN